MKRNQIRNLQRQQGRRERLILPGFPKMVFRYEDPFNFQKIIKCLVKNLRYIEHEFYKLTTRGGTKIFFFVPLDENQIFNEIVTFLFY